MTIFSAFYTLLIKPIELLLEVIFTMSYYLTHSAGLSVVILSFAMNILLLPIYKRADLIQEEETKKENELRDGVKYFKKTFKGDEQYLLLQTYYRQNNYKPYYSLRNSISLLLEIPFFMAAYNFLSSLDVFDNVSFGLISNLGLPDGALFGLNMLPILMTLINILSSAIYLKGQPMKNRVQLYVMALVFLVLLYNKKSALVLYWTLNNLFSLVKNILSKLKNSKQIVYYCLFGIGLAGNLYLIFVNHLSSSLKLVLSIVLMTAIQLPLIISKIKINTNSLEKYFSESDNRLFYYGCIFICLFVGLLIPTITINANPEEFMDSTTLTNPIIYVINTFLLAIGIFVIWSNVFYALLNDKVKKVANILIWILCGVCVVDFYFFGKDLGNMSNLLVYDDFPFIETKEQLINIIVLFITAIVFILIAKKKFVKMLLCILSLTLFIVSSINIYQINDTIKNSPGIIVEDNTDETLNINLSKIGKNVIVIMFDRAIGPFFPYIINENKELKKQYEDFTYYPNTLSYGSQTAVASPSLYGGYEYTPTEIDKRDDELLSDKQNEALLVMPTIFEDNDYDVVVTDPSLAGYKFYPDLSIYDGHPNIKAYITDGKIIDDDFIVEHDLTILNRNLLCHSICKIMPSFLHTLLYNNGDYYSGYSITSPNHQIIHSLSSARGVNSAFINWYSVLKNLPNLTTTDNENNTFTLLVNEITHNQVLLQEPNYEVSGIVENGKYEDDDYSRTSITGDVLHFSTVPQISHYHSDFAAFQMVGKWIDYLKANDVYNNTRIIIVSDHGSPLNIFDDMMFGDKKYEDAVLFNPLLLVKDFNSNDFKIDDEFMTNADVAYLATKDIIDNPTNPYTGKQISNNAKYGEQIVYYTDTSLGYGRNVFEPQAVFSNYGNIFNKNNWKIIKEAE